MFKKFCMPRKATIKPGMQSGRYDCASRYISTSAGEGFSHRRSGYRSLLVGVRHPAVLTSAFRRR